MWQDILTHLIPILVAGGGAWLHGKKTGTIDALDTATDETLEALLAERKAKRNLH